MSRSTLSLRAIAAGLIIDFVGSLVATVGFGFVLGAVLAAQGFSLYQLQRMTSEPAFLVSQLVLGLAFTFVGGYVAGRLSDGGEVVNACLVGMMGVGMAVALQVYLPDAMHVPDWYSTAAYTLTAPIAVLGGSAALAGKETRGYGAVSY